MTPRFIPPLHLGEASVHEQLGPGNVAAVIGREKNNGFRDLIGGSEPPKRNGGSNGGESLMARRRGPQQLGQTGCINRSWADRVDANVAVLQVGRPSSGKRAYGRLRRAVDAI